MKYSTGFSSVMILRISAMLERAGIRYSPGSTVASLFITHVPARKMRLLLMSFWAARRLPMVPKPLPFSTRKVVSSAIGPSE
jgi:hypothetical protein